MAKEKNSNRDVIIEIKKYNANPNKQLLNYSKNFNKPILVCVSESIIKTQIKDIVYIVIDKW